MICYRRSKVSDSNQIAKIHMECFSNFFLTSLGYSFLKTYYRSCTNNKEAISICAVNKDDNKLLGFAVGCLNSKGFNKRLILSNLLEYSYRSIILLFTKPIALIRLLKNLEKNNNKNDKGNYAELLSIGVSPDHEGLGIGKKLLFEFENQITAKGIKLMTLTTDADFNDSVLKFYKKSGYSVYYDFETFPKRKMLKLIKEL